MGKSSSSQLEREIAESLAGAAKPKKSRKRKVADAPETERQKLERLVEEQKARARASHRHGLSDSTEQNNLLFGARRNLARRIAFDLGHNVANQGISYECYRCGASGTFDIEPIGSIFTSRCGE